MLVLGRKAEEDIHILDNFGGTITIRILEIGHRHVRVGIQAGKAAYHVYRAELLQKMQDGSVQPF